MLQGLRANVRKYRKMTFSPPFKAGVHLSFYCDYPHYCDRNLYYVNDSAVEETSPVILPPASQEVPQNALDDSPALRKAECPDIGPACPSPQVPVCHNGEWYCREFSPEGIETGDNLTFPAEEALRQGCPDPGLACEVPETPECRNGKWVCTRPAESAG